MPQTGRYSLADLDQPREAALTITSGEPSQASGRFSLADLDATQPSLSKAIDMAADATPLGVLPVSAGTALGMGKEGLAQITRVGNLIRLIPGMRAADEAVPHVDLPMEAVTPTTPAQKGGRVALNVAESIIPAAGISRAGMAAGTATARMVGGPAALQVAARLAPRMAVEGAAGAGTAAVQGGDPVKGAIIGAAAPVAGAALGAAASRIAPKLKDAAEATVVKALGPTKERFKAMAEKIAPEVLSRGLRGSREALQAQAREATQAAGQQIDDVIKTIGNRPVNSTTVVDAFEASKDAFRGWRPATVQELTANPDLARQARAAAAGGFEVPVPHSPQDARALGQIEALQQTVEAYGPTMRVDQLVAMRRAWDKVVAQAGGFAQRGKGAIGVSLKDASEAAIKRDGTTAIRKLLDTDAPELSALNKEYAFWKTLDDVVTQSIKRTAPQGPSLGRQLAEAAGGAIGGAVGTAAGGPVVGVGSAVALGKAAGIAKTVFSSPRWKLASAQMKDALADAIMSGNATRVEDALGQIAAGPVNAEKSPRPAIP